MKHILVVLMGLVLMSAEVEAQIPPQIQQFPVFADSATAAAEMERLDLRLDTLKAPWKGLNWYESIRGTPFKHFVYDSLPAGTAVYVGKDTLPRYKAKCGNLLVSLTECPACPYVPASDTVMVTQQNSISVFPDSLRAFGEVRLAGPLLVRVEATTPPSPLSVPVTTGVRWHQRTRWQIVMGTTAGLIIGGLYKCATDWCHGGDINILIVH